MLLLNLSEIVVFFVEKVPQSHIIIIRRNVNESIAHQRVAILRNYFFGEEMKAIVG